LVRTALQQIFRGRLFRFVTGVKQAAQMPSLIAALVPGFQAPKA
jgi:hypothetical protein